MLFFLFESGKTKCNVCVQIIETVVQREVSQNPSKDYFSVQLGGRGIMGEGEVLGSPAQNLTYAVIGF